jgi:hypothetical protein
MARGWHRHHRGGVDTGDVLAGVLIFGGIAAIAAAASQSNRDKREREQVNRYPQRDYRGAPDYRGSPDYRSSPDYREPPQRYGDGSESNSYGANSRSGSSMDDAVDICANEVERGDRQIESVESVSREPNGWRVDGRISGARDYSCIVDHSGQIRRVTVDGRAII